MKLISFVLPSHLPGMGGWGNGYVAIPKGHPCYEMDYDAIHDKYEIDVSGGLTFASPSIKGQPEETKGMWIVGFDTLHYGDNMERWPDEHSVLFEANRLLEQLDSIAVTSF
jgi:hypothetical protein